MVLISVLRPLNSATAPHALCLCARLLCAQLRRRWLLSHQRVANGQSIAVSTGGGLFGLRKSAALHSSLCAGALDETLCFSYFLCRAATKIGHQHVTLSTLKAWQILLKMRRAVTLIAMNQGHVV